MAITDYKDPDYVASEVLASLIRARYGQDTGQLDAAVNALNRRVVASVNKQIQTSTYYKCLADSRSELVADTVSYVWDKLLADPGPVPNCEVRFAVFLGNRVDDYMRHQDTFDNALPSSDDMDLEGDEGDAIRLVDTLVDREGETPEDYALRVERHERVLSALIKLPRIEQKAFYLREECEFDWTKVAKLLGCSVPTARKHCNNSVEKMKGEL
ncbi:sigma factor-like helix-turn-helix DNA-binding protein [Lysobacter sp. TAF61]|uniref:sigma factor-like helix-turn-helix DNA-binding protein n=1 Tax=Lysobacter sp. TAF61 TaxID=3233072 RepID=UPI003F97EC17